MRSSSSRFLLTVVLLLLLLLLMTISGFIMVLLDADLTEMHCGWGHYSMIGRDDHLWLTRTLRGTGVCDDA